MLCPTCLHRHQRALRALPKVKVVDVLIARVVAQVAQPRVQLGGAAGKGRWAVMVGIN